VSWWWRPFQQEDVRFLKNLIEAGSVAAVVDRSYGLGEVPEALRYMEGGHARGKIVVTV
jgi:NADPH:quinone reductase-like Zn-dependent oxidoreductase